MNGQRPKVGNNAAGKEGIGVEVEGAGLGGDQRPEVRVPRQHRAQIVTIHEKDAFRRVLLQQLGEVFRPSVYGEEQSHPLSTGATYLAIQTVEVADVRELGAPAAFNEVPYAELEGAVDLLTAFVALRRSRDWDGMEPEESIEEVLQHASRSVDA